MGTCQRLIEVCLHCGNEKVINTMATDKEPVALNIASDIR